jgi:hypothetical protein
MAFTSMIISILTLKRSQPGVFREFTDDITWKRYVKSGGGLARNEWRRQNVQQTCSAPAS